MRPNWENECVSKSALIEWLRPYLHTGEPIPADVLISDIQMMPPTLTPPNEPLTLEQLREINGEPIYVTTKNYGDGWCILNWHGVNKSYTCFSRTGTSEGMTATPLSAKTYGDLWLAYRRPPEGEEDT